MEYYIWIAIRWLCAILMCAPLAYCLAIVTSYHSERPTHIPPLFASRGYRGKVFKTSFIFYLILSSGFLYYWSAVVVMSQ